MLERNAAITIGTGGLISNGISSVTIGGSSANHTYGAESTIAGGMSNEAKAWGAAIGGGHSNNANTVNVTTVNGDTITAGDTVTINSNGIDMGGMKGVSKSRVAIGKEVLELKQVVAKQDAQIQKLTAMLNGFAGTNANVDTTKLFPDVPSNHWAYEAVAAMSRSGLVEGYPKSYKPIMTSSRY